MYIYESHTGGHYWSEQISNDLHCDSCGDSDQYLGFAENKEAVSKLLDSKIYNKSYIRKFIESIPFEK